MMYSPIVFQIEGRLRLKKFVLQAALANLLFVVLLHSVLCAGEGNSRKRRVAIIGGGVSGTFAAKYLVDYDHDCSLESVVVFEPDYIGRDTALDASPPDLTGDNFWQGGRVASIRLEDGTMIEIGATIAHSGFYFLNQMLLADENLQKGPPFYTGKEDTQRRTGFGIYDGNGNFAVLTSNTPSFLTKLKLFYRYNADFIRLLRVTSDAVQSFGLIHKMLEGEMLFESPQEMWDAVGLGRPAQMPYSGYLDEIGVEKELSWWRKLLPFQGLLRDELVTAANLVNYNQANSQVNALVGLGSFSATQGSLFSIVGGNNRLLRSAMNQAQANHESKCEMKGVVQQVQKRVTSVVGDLDGMQLFSDNQDLGEFDVVILAAPIQQSRISFLIRSHMDGAVLQPMPLNGMVDAVQQESNDGDGRNVLPKPLPSSATRPYTSVVTTIVSGVDMKVLAQHFSLSVDELPRSILVTENGKRLEKNITSVSQVSSSGVYKVFSSGRLDERTLEGLFGKTYAVEHIKEWGGPYGGATPDYRGEGHTMNYLLYDSGLGLDGHTGGALFYANAIEASFACMELSAVGAKSAAKLAARHLDLIAPTSPENSRDEL